MPHTELASRGRVLLGLARGALAQALQLPPEAAARPEAAPWLQADGATFVTLTQQGALRGCIGTLVAWRPLQQDVQANAVAAALRDPRFAPLSAREFGHTDIEVSLLSAPEPMTVADEDDALAQLRPGVDGVIFEYRHARSTFLPQVWEQLPDPAEFMAHLKHKAGLGTGFWAAQVRLARYTVTKWKETDLNRSEGV